MNGAAWLLLTAALGVDFGWQFGADGKLEYIIQIPDSQYESIRTNPEGTISNIPPEVLPHLRRIRIVVGNNQLPQEKLPAGVGVLAPGNANFANDPINARAVGMQATGENSTPFVPNAPESSVQPLDRNSVLPGPGYDDPNAAVDNTLLALPNTRNVEPNFSDFQTQPTTNFRPAEISRQSINLNRVQPQITPPGFYQTPPNRGFNEQYGFADQQASYNPNPNTNANSPYGGYGFNGNNSQRNTVNTAVQPIVPTSYAMVMIGLCLSIGANMFLGWLAWEYYLRYRDSFETWRNSSR